MVTLTRVESIEEANYVTIGKAITGVTVGRMYELKFDSGIGFKPNTDHREHQFINDNGQPMTLSGVWNFFNCKFYK